MAPAPTYAYDLETTSLNPYEGAITTIALFSPEVTVVIEDRDESRLIRHFASVLRGLPAGGLLSWNGACFDNPWLQVRTNANHLPRWFTMSEDPTITLKYQAVDGFKPVGYDLAAPAADGSHTHRDVAYQWRTWAGDHQVPWRLKPVARANGIHVIEVDRANMDALTIPERMAYGLAVLIATWHLGQIPQPAIRTAHSVGSAA